MFSLRSALFRRSNLLTSAFRAGFSTEAAAIPAGQRKPDIQATGLFINNEFRAAKSGAKRATLNPATKEVICEVAEGDRADVDLAVAAAQKAFAEGSEWRKMQPSERGALLHRLTDLIQRDQAHMASLESLDSGKLYHTAYGVDMTFAIQYLRYFAGWANKHHGHTIPVDGEFLCYTRNEPIGVVGTILPWNFPTLMLAWKLGPCIVSGCPIIVKPAQQTPLTTLHLAKLALEAGFPPGVFQVITGDGPTAGQALVEHPGVDKIAFTGSTRTGQLIAQTAAQHGLKRVSLELGGKSPLIVLPDADLEAAVEDAHNALFFNMGETCVAASRTFIHKEIHDQFLEAAVERAKKVKVGDPFDATNEQGAQIDDTQTNKIMGLIETGKRDGAKLCLGGKRFDPTGTGGYFVEPTVFSEVTDNMAIAKDEIFGPVQQIMRFDKLEEAVARANTTSYGLAAAVYTSDMGKAVKVANDLKAGTVWINCYGTADPAAPFGGMKMSGYGRDRGEKCLEGYTELKCVTAKIPGLVN